MKPSYFDNLNAVQIAEVIQLASKEKLEQPVDASIVKIVQTAREQTGLMSESIPRLASLSSMDIFYAVRSWISKSMRDEVRSLLNISEEDLKKIAA